MSEQYRVLLVDDEKDLTAILAKRLTQRKIATEMRNDCASALEYLQDGGNPEVIVLDLKMPGIDGLTCLKKIKEIKPKVEVIILSGHADVDAAIEGMRLGAFDYLMKPADMDELRFKIEDAAAKHRLNSGAG